MSDKPPTRTALRTAVMIIGSIAAVELLIHLIFHLAKADFRMSETTRIILDVIVLSSAASFAFFFWIFKPFRLAEQQRLTAIELQRERDRLQQYLDTAGAMFVVLNRDQSIALINRKGCRILGYEERELLGRNWFDAIVPETAREGLRSLFDRLMKNEIDPVEYFEHDIVTKNGEERTIAWHNTIVRDVQGAVVSSLSAGEDITERRRAANLLAESEHKFRSLTEQSLVGTYILQDGLFRYVNPRFASIFGYSIEEIIDTVGPRDLTLPDDWPSVQEYIRKREAREVEHVNYDFRGVRKDGQIVNIEVLGSNTVYHGRDAVIGTLMDITERKRTEDVIDRERTFANNLLQNSAVATFVLDARHNVLIWNRACEELTGVSASAMVGANLYRKPFHEQERPVLAGIILDGNADQLSSAHPEFTKSVLMPDGLHGEGWFRNLNGKDRFIVFDAAPIRDSEGAVVAAIETMQDFTERKMLEQQILQSKQDWEDTFNTITDMITLHDREFNIIRSNRAAEQMLQLPPLGSSLAKCYMHYHGTECAPARCPSCSSLVTGRPSVTEMFEPHLNKFLEIRAIPRFDKDRHLIGLIHVVRDISEHKKLEEQLFQAQKMEAVGQLAGGVAHDFNNILTAILGDLYILGMKLGVHNPLIQYINDIRHSSEKAAALTQSLLAFSRKQVINPKPLSLNATVQKVQKLMARIVGEDVCLKTVQTGMELMVMADGGQLEQVLMNLITNARDSMPQGGTLTISTSYTEIDEAYIARHGFGTVGDYALLSVADTGIGMDEKTRERIFEPFFTTKEVGKGTGLGLSIVYGIIKQHNGFIDCLSVQRVGTVFNIYLPLIDEEHGAEDQISTSIPDRGREHILLAEDDASVRKTTKAIIEEFDYVVVEAVDGEDAVRKFRENSSVIQLLVMDVIMPKKNGKEAYVEIKAINPDVKILFLSGYSNDIIHKRGILDESVNFLPKPSSPIALLSKIREILDRRC